MALNAVHNRRLESPELLLTNLVETVQFLLDVCVFKHSVFFLFSGLHLLHTHVKSILSHGTRVNHYLIFSQPSFATFDTWLQKALQDHSLLQFLTRDPERLKCFYHDWAFLQKENLYQALLDCLYVLATRDLEVLNRIPSFPVDKFQKKAFVLPSSGIPVIIESHASINQSKPFSYSRTQLKLPEQSIHIIHEQNALLKSQSKMEQKNDTEVENITSNSSSVPEFSYGSPMSPLIGFDEVDNQLHILSLEKSSSSALVDDKNEIPPTLPIPVPSSSVTGASIPSPIPKSFMESGFRIQPTAMGSFPLPQKGQSVASFLESLSDAAMPELDRENAHFNISEALISAFESAKVKKWNEAIERKQIEEKTRTMFGEVASTSRRSFNKRRVPPRPVYSETESEFDCSKQRPRRPPVQLKKKSRNAVRLDSEGHTHTESFLSATDISPSLTSSSEDVVSTSFSAEQIALNLLRSAKLSEGQLADASELKWLVTERDAPQALLPMPKTWSASESDTDSLNMRLRGTADWAPPRAQIIFTEHPPPNLHQLLRKSKYIRCAGCGIRVDSKYASTLRYCNYLGRYFCTGCHSLKKARIPQKILHKWDFSPYYVSNFSATLLESLQSDPVYNVKFINPSLYRQRRMNSFRNMRIQLQHLAVYLRNCKNAAKLYEEFDTLPTYYTADVDLYSLEDFLDLRFGIGFPLKLKQLLSIGIDHVLKCQLCHQLGFHCEICKKNEVLFPFQISRVSRCETCSTCFHSKCFNPASSACPKCIRLSRRRIAANNIDLENVDPNSVIV